jgi:aminopeptidase N
MYEVAAISRQTIEYYSKVFPAVPYPYPRMTVFNGSGGMEFPMMVNEDKSNERKWTVYVTTHEIAHTYFPFYMGINERKYAWMDEGWAQNLSEKAQKLIAPDLDQQARNVFRFLNYSGNETDVPMMVTTDNVHNGSSYGNSSYFRPDNAYNFLEDALGHELFMKALHEYISRWHGKHPIPYDFFFTFENVAKQDLGWFFKPWFFEQGYPAIGNVSMKNGSLKITVEKLGNLPVPIYITAKTSDGDSLVLSESCSVWKDGHKEAVVELKTNKKIISVTLGNPYIPDAVPENNTYVIK